MENNTKVLILGGAGFIGSNIAHYFIKKGYAVTIIDGFLDQTGADRRNLSDIQNKITLINTRIEETAALESILETHKLIIDCMGWSLHWMAMKNPTYDLKLNVLSHLSLLDALRTNKEKGHTIIFLGSRGQYGNPKVKRITEETAMEPVDIQGIHKVAAESHFKVFSELYGYAVASIRFPNCFGPNQISTGNDIGLIGGFIRSALNNTEVKIYGKNRKRNLIYVGDLAEIVYRLSEKPLKGFTALNFGGHELSIREIVQKIIAIAGKGDFTILPVPQEIKTIDMQTAKLDDSKLRRLLGRLPKSNADESFSKTIQYFKERMQ